MRRLPGTERFLIAGLNKEALQFAAQMRAEVMKEEVVAAEDARGDHDIGIDGPERQAQAAGKRTPPAFGLSGRILVADENRGADFFKEGFEGASGGAPDHKAYAALLLRRLHR